MDVSKVNTINITFPKSSTIHRLDFVKGQKQVSINGQYQQFLQPFPYHKGGYQMSLGGTPYTSPDGINFSPAQGQVNRVLVKLPNKFLANTVGKLLHKWPVWATSITLSCAGSYFFSKPIWATDQELNSRLYLRQNPVDTHNIFTHEMNNEIHLLLTAPLDAIPVKKREFWSLLGNVEPLYHKMNSYKDPKSPEAQETYKQYLAESYQVLFELYQKNYGLSEKARDFQQGALYAVNDLPAPKPLQKREFPDVVSLAFVNQSVMAPPADAPRSEFVKYYATKYNIDY